MGESYTIEEYLRGLVGIDVPDSTLRSILFKRGVDEGSHAAWLGERELDLCSADIYLWCYLLPSSGRGVKDHDGDWSHEENNSTMTMADKRALRALARQLYDKWGENVPTDSKIVLHSFGVL